MLQRPRLTAFAAIVAAAVLAFPPLAGAEGGHNHVTVVNQSDGRLATQGRAVLAVDHGPTVDNENTAIARASCTDCRTVAVAVQVLAVDGTASDFAPLNAAVAVNDECTRCQTYAYARQEVITVDGPFTLTADGRDRIDRLEAAIEQTAGSGEPFVEMGADLDSLVVELRTTVLAEIDRAGRRTRSHTVRRDVDSRG